MKRFTGVRVLTQALTDSDIGIFIGSGICEEAAPYVGKGAYLFLSDAEDYLLSMTLGIAMCTEKRVFVFCEDQYFIRNMSELMQIGVSKCRNYFVVLFVSGEYTEVPNTPTIFSSVNSRHGILYNMGFIVHDYKNHFKFSKNPISFIRNTWDRVRGPIAVLMSTDRGSKQMPRIEFSTKKDVYKLKKFILDTEIKAHNFVPPANQVDLVVSGG